MRETMPANILRFDSDSSAFKEFSIEQEHAPDETIHDHVERPATGDGWLSSVRNGDEIRGPFRFTGDALAEMKRWAAEKPEPLADPAE